MELFTELFLNTGLKLNLIMKRQKQPQEVFYEKAFLRDCRKFTAYQKSGTQDTKVGPGIQDLKVES